MNILSNNIGAEQANELIKIMESKDNLKTLCGFSGDETELDLSGKGLSAGCAVLVAHEVKNNGALYFVDIRANSIPDKQAEEIDKLIRRNRLRPIMQDSEKSLSELDLSSRFLDNEDALAVAEYVKNNSVLTSLNVSGNKLNAEGATHIVAAIRKCQ